MSLKVRQTLLILKRVSVFDHHEKYVEPFGSFVQIWFAFCSFLDEVQKAIEMHNGMKSTFRDHDKRSESTLKKFNDMIPLDSVLLL